MTSILLIPLFLLTADEPRWELSTQDTGVKIYARKRADSEIREMKAMGLLEATPQEIWKAVRDLEHYPSTMPYTEEAKVLSREPEDKVILFYSKINTPMVDRRDYIIRLVDESDWKEGKGFYKVSWTVVNDKDELAPVKPDVVRVRVNDGYWLLEPREEGKRTFVTYYIYTAPGGSIPTFIANQGNTIAVPKVFDAVRKTIAAERAQASKAK